MAFNSQQKPKLKFSLNHPKLEGKKIMTKKYAINSAFTAKKRKKSKKKEKDAKKGKRNSDNIF